MVGVVQLVPVVGGAVVVGVDPGEEEAEVEETAEPVELGDKSDWLSAMAPSEEEAEVEEAAEPVELEIGRAWCRERV